MFNKVFDDNNVSTIFEGRDCQIYQMQDSDGEGLMTSYKVLDGVYLMYNDFHIKEYKSDHIANSDVFCIDHCRQGRIEYSSNGRFSYLKAGDLRIDNRKSYGTNFTFPLSHYHGLTVTFFMDIAPKSLQECFKGFPININNLHKKYCDSNRYFVIRSESTIEHIFTELYAVPKKIKDYYFKIKIFELLLYLDALEISEHQEKRPYFYKAQVEKIKSIQALITNNLEHHFTLDDLSEQFDISLTPMKSCFKGVYGTSIYAYIRSYRMSTAAVLLKTTQKSVAEIACKVGYSSPSKFSSAFKDVMAMSPMQYRKSLV